MDAAVAAVRQAARWFEPAAEGLGPLLDAIGEARWAHDEIDLPETYPSGI